MSGEKGDKNNQDDQIVKDDESNQNDESQVMFLEYIKNLQLFAGNNQILRFMSCNEPSAEYFYTLDKIVNDQRPIVENLLSKFIPENFDLSWALNNLEECKKLIDKIVSLLTLPWEHDPETLCDKNCEQIYNNFVKIIKMLRLEAPKGPEEFYRNWVPPKPKAGSSSDGNAGDVGDAGEIPKEESDA